MSCDRTIACSRSEFLFQNNSLQVLVRCAPQDEWLLRLSPDGNLPALGSLPSAEAPKEEVTKIVGLNDAHGATMKEMATYLDR